MQLRDHDKPCKHEDSEAQHVNDGEYWWCGVCPGGAAVTPADLPRRCPNQKREPGTVRVFWRCSLPEGHTGDCQAPAFVVEPTRRTDGRG